MTVTIDAEVDMGDIETADLVEELVNRWEHHSWAKGSPNDEERKELRQSIEPMLKKLSISPFPELEINTLTDTLKLSHLISVWNKYSLSEIENKLP